MAARQVHECALCAYQCSVTAGTIFHKTRTPLSSWFWAIYRMSHDKKGISAMQLAKEIGVSYPTAWLMLHKIRKAMSDRDQHYRLSGLVEVDEGYVGGEEHGEGRRGRGTARCADQVRGGLLRWSIAELANRARSRFQDLPLWRGDSRCRHRDAGEVISP
jgi:hypothetical protein